MEKYSINELGGFITVSAGAIATVLFALQKSSCTSIKCCGCECVRDPKLVKKHLDNADTPRPLKDEAPKLPDDKSNLI
jgi:hypothetical protein